MQKKESMILKTIRNNHSLKKRTPIKKMHLTGAVSLKPELKTIRLKTKCQLAITLLNRSNEL